MFTDAKIPYGVETKNGSVVANTVYAGDYVLVDGKTVKVTDNTGLNKTYTVTAIATSEKLKTASANYELTATLEPVSEITSPYSGDQTFTLKVVLNVKSDVSISDPTNDLKVEDITVKITAEHTS